VDARHLVVQHGLTCTFSSCGVVPSYIWILRILLPVELGITFSRCCVVQRYLIFVFRKSWIFLRFPAPSQQIGLLFLQFLFLLM
jgi:hypothetical protein